MADKILAAPRIVVQSTASPNIRREQAVMAALELIRAAATKTGHHAVNNLIGDVSNIADKIESALESKSE